MSIAFDKRDYIVPTDDLEDVVAIIPESSSSDEDTTPAEVDSHRPKVATFDTILRWEAIQDYCHQNSFPLFDRCTSQQLGVFLHRYYPSLE